MIKKDSDKFAKVNGVVPLERIELDIMLSKSLTIFVKCTQFSIMLAWACTIPKVQGLTLLNLAVLLQTNNTSGQFYVVVNCAIALSKAFLIGDLTGDMVCKCKCFIRI